MSNKSLGSYQYILRQKNIGYHQRTWEYFLNQGYINKQEIFTYPLAILYGLNSIIRILHETPIENRIELLQESEGLHRLFAYEDKGSKLPELLKHSILRILAMLPEIDKYDLICNADILESSIKYHPLLIEPILGQLHREIAHHSAIEGCLKMAIAEGKAESLAIILNMIAPEQRFDTLVNSTEILLCGKRTRKVNMALLHKATRSPTCLRVLFDEIPETYHENMLNIRVSLDDGIGLRYGNVLHAAIFYKSAESLELLLNKLPIELLRQKILEEKINGWGSVRDMVESKFYCEFRSIISKYLALADENQFIVDRLADNGATRNTFFPTASEEKSDSDASIPSAGL